LLVVFLRYSRQNNRTVCYIQPRPIYSTFFPKWLTDRNYLLSLKPIYIYIYIYTHLFFYSYCLSVILTYRLAPSLSFIFFFPFFVPRLLPIFFLVLVYIFPFLYSVSHNWLQGLQGPIHVYYNTQCRLQQT
jgi:hypothetical protein